MTTTTALAAEITATDDPAVMRRLATAALIPHAEAAAERATRIYGDDAPTRDEVIAAVMIEAAAWWTVETSYTHTSADEYRQDAHDLHATILEQIHTIAAQLVPVTTHRRVSAEVIADVRGPGDED
ncbi:hypothetical protein [Pseudonocardia asaccharolytica]|uniref:Uncharacterized protein n=1 Tax=Pseudonocardia asaccharolytica DSM 44247 = NBRC 16224 TaxID=1123024 RepID=A0A511D3I0_9PSEU|nr:hypothetical protein [Pseudonocardia asaccharolytica]GEL19325.1 hypothetical protein PA7_31620 [Pseudonocardia asaccharolytica DSM 44247 = NBRC 16224]